MKTERELFDFLPGIWKMNRRIVSQTGSHILQKANGYASFIVSKTDKNLLVYSERVNLYDLEQKTTYVGTQNYQYKYNKKRSMISKYFRDGKFFYTLNVLNDKVEAVHVCIKDTYKSKYVFQDNRFILIYFINGPSKGYNIITEYRKIKY